MSEKVLAILGPTASGKSALSLAVAESLNGEIINCDSTAVYRGFDIGTDKLPVEERRGIPHHLIDIADPTDVYTAARFAEDADRTIRDIHRRGRLPVLVGGTGFYYRALTRGLFPGPGAHVEIRRRLDRVAQRKGPERLHRLLQSVDPGSAERIMRGALFAVRDEPEYRDVPVHSAVGGPAARAAEGIEMTPGVIFISTRLRKSHPVS